MRMIKPEVYCIIVTYNAMQWIEDCLDSVLQSLYPLHLIIIDNCSKDETVNFIKNNYSNLELIQNKENLGFGGANNLGVKMAITQGANFVFLLNQDTRIYPETVGRTLEVFKLDSKIGVASPFHLNDDGSALDFNFEFHLKYTKERYISDITLNKKKLFYEIEFTNAASWFVKTEVIKKIGLFSDAFFHYGEDVNFIHRLHFFGYKCVVVPSVYIHHCREERKGKFNYNFEKKRSLIDAQIALLNVNQSYSRAFFKVINNAIRELVSKNFRLAFSLIKFSFLNYNKFKKCRKVYVKRKV